MVDVKTVTISEKEYNRLVADSQFLDRLHVVGVDNWEGYGEACEEDDSY